MCVGVVARSIILYSLRSAAGTAEANASLPLRVFLFPFLPGNRAGCQEDNLFDYNLAALVHIIDRLSDYDNGGGQGNAKSLTCLRQSHSNPNNVEEREIAQQFLECNAKYCIFFEISSYSEYL